MPTELVNLQLDELSLVDKGANQFAKAPIFKADTSNGEHMTTETIDKMSDGMKAKLKPYLDKGMSMDDAMKAYENDMKKSADEEVATLKAENERLRKALLEGGYTIKADTIEKKAPDEFIEYGGEKINKADVPAPILKALEEAEVEKADNALTKRAEETLPNFAVDVAKSLLTAVEKSADAEKLMETLKAADSAFAGSFAEVGKSDVNGDFEDPNDKLDAMAKARQAEKGETYAKAYTAVTKTEDGKALLKAIYKKDQ